MCLDANVILCAPVVRRNQPLHGHLAPGCAKVARHFAGSVLTRRALAEELDGQQHVPTCMSPNKFAGESRWNVL
jgi:hypothetical protein